MFFPFRVETCLMNMIFYIVIIQYLKTMKRKVILAVIKSESGMVRAW
jgi:hypothetical protein